MRLADHHNFVLHEGDTIGLPGIYLNLSDENGSLWLKIERLLRIEPPAPDEEIAEWIEVFNDPAKQPIVRESLSDVCLKEEADLLIAEGLIKVEQVLELAEQESELKPTKVRITRILADEPELQTLVQSYISEDWSAWATEEILRRKTINVYEQLFRVQQMLESEGAENPIEILWGLGVVRWNYQSSQIDYPLILLPVEVEVDSRGKCLLVRPREVRPLHTVRIFEDLDIPSTRLVKEYFHKALQSVELEISPFQTDPYRDLLQFAASHLDERGVYLPETSEGQSRKLSTADRNLKISDTWVLFARKRSADFLLKDLEALAQAVEECEELPEATKRLVSQPPDQRVEIGEIPRLQDGRPPFSTSVEDENVYFPKPFNEEQYQIAQLLKRRAGIVVQGPPGTGKSHTIANVICHTLATGGRVLVTSKAEPALSVLREQIPESIRPLVISLLTSEREGFQLVEIAARTLTTTVRNLDNRQAKKDAQFHEKRIESLYGELARIESTIGSWAAKQLVPVAQPVGDGKANAFELAQKLMEEKERHAWFPDALGFGEEYEPQFGFQDVEELRRLRRTLGADISYTFSKLPDASALPTGAELARVHQDLVQTLELEEEARRELPYFASSAPSAVSRAKVLLQQLEEAITIQETASETQWKQQLLNTLRHVGVEALELQPLRELWPLLDQLTQERLDFVAKPVTIPAYAGEQATYREAVIRAARGERPFGLLGLAGKQVKEAITETKVSGISISTAAGWAHVLRYLDFLIRSHEGAVRWNAVADEFKLPMVEEANSAVVKLLGELRKEIGQLQRLIGELNPAIINECSELFPTGLRHQELQSEVSELKLAAKALKIYLSKQSLASSQQMLRTYKDLVRSCSGCISVKIQEFLAEAVGNPMYASLKLADGWEELRTELIRLQSLDQEFITLRDLLEQIKDSGAELWAKKLGEDHVAEGVDVWTPAHWHQSWTWHRLHSYLREINGQDRIQTLFKKRRQLTDDLQNAFENLVLVRTHLKLKEGMTERVLSALSMFVNALQRIGKGTGVSAARHRKDARSAIQCAYEAVPCWIMPHWRVSEVFPAEIGMFDLVIIDEASQSDVWALPAIMRGKKVLIVGDDRQISPANVGVSEEDKLRLRNQYLYKQVYHAELMPGSSVFELANAMFPGDRIMLQEHFRCVEPIIRFSSRFYEDQGGLQPLRIPKASERLDPPLIDVYVEDGVRIGKINKPEAAAIVDEICRLVNDPAYENRTIGIISLIGQEQAHYIMKLLLQRIGEEKFLEHSITCGDAMTFQGKERDIMFLSMVAAPGSAVAQTSETRAYAQRFNVACSRARDRMYLYRSVEAEDLSNPLDLKRLLIEHFKCPMPEARVEVDDLRSLCESEFERDVFDRLTKLNYRVFPQVKAGRYRIDLVVEGKHDRRLAVELDGNKHHGPEQWADDMMRQRVLERLGWIFWRCWGSSFALNPQVCMADLVATLTALQIEPIGYEMRTNTFTEHRRIQAFRDEDRTGFTEEQGFPGETSLALLE